MFLQLHYSVSNILLWVSKILGRKTALVELWVEIILSGSCVDFVSVSAIFIDIKLNCQEILWQMTLESYSYGYYWTRVTYSSLCYGSYWLNNILIMVVVVADSMMLRPCKGK